MSRPPRTSPLFPNTTFFRFVRTVDDQGLVATAGVVGFAARAERTERDDKRHQARREAARDPDVHGTPEVNPTRSEEHTSELQSRQYLVCRLLLEKKNTQP